MTVDRLSAEDIREHLSPAARQGLRGLTLLETTVSTNEVLARLPIGQRHGHAVLAEEQTAGRGRRQRTWHSPAGGNIYLSLGWRFGERPPALSVLPLVAAVCLCRALGRAGLSGHGIKWPNDILVDGAKLAGILVETQSAGVSPALAVIGIGVNVRMPESGSGGAIDRPWTDLVTALPGRGESITRNELIALLLEELLAGLAAFEASGFEPFQADWDRLDLLRGRRVNIEGNGGFRVGTVLGIDDRGGLNVDIDGYGPQVLHAAEVSIHDP
jgi:BirA family biotin operon repressor/biotin-[acetyl-CoA-carboxylase] ligase